MGDFFSITLVSGIILLCLYMPYKLLLAGARQHRFNRLVMMGLYLVSVTVPLLMRMDIHVGGSESGHLAQPVADITFGPLTGGIIPQAAPVWARVALWIYLVGVAVTLTRFIWVYLRLLHIIRTGCRQERNGYTLVIARDASISPFSWHKYVVVGDPEDAEENKAVMIHELRHLSALHSLDIFMAQIYAIAVWYNPVSWLMIDELKTVHEYEADEAVIDSGVNLKEYQMLLIKKTAGTRLPSLANSLNHSKLQKRISMMYQSKSKLAGKIGTLVLLPAMAIGVAVVSVPAIASVISDASEATLVESAGKVSEKSDKTEIAAMTPRSVADAPALKAADEVSPALIDSESGVAEPSVMPESVEEAANNEATDEEPTREVYTAVEQSAEFPGGVTALMNWLGSNIRYPEDAVRDDVQGRVIVKFVVNADGRISDAKVVKGVATSLDNEAIRVVQSMPAWQPAQNDGKKVASWFVLPVSFKLSAPEPKDTTSTVRP